MTDLILLGVGGIVGTGVFVLTGRAAALHAGPGVMLSFALAGLAAALAAMCYAEASSRVPSSGGAYAYVRASMGEFGGWVVGWDLMLEYLVGNALVAVGWSAYAMGFLRRVFGLSLDGPWFNAPLSWDPHAHALVKTGSYVNAPALLILLAVTAQLHFGLRKTTRINAFLVAFKVGVILLFIAILMPNINRQNLTPFVPANTGTFGEFGFSGVFQAAGLLFFSYVGFDALVTAGHELHNSRRNLPRCLFITLGTCTLIYVLTAFTLTGTTALSDLNVSNSISFAAEHSGHAWLSYLIDLAAIAGLLSSIAMGAMAQPRIVFSMAQDGLLPKRLGRLNAARTAPSVATNLCGGLCATVAGLLPVELLNELVSVGTLFNFAAVSCAVPFLRRQLNANSDIYSVPGGPYLVPSVSVLVCVGLLAAGGLTGIIRVLGWLLIGALIYQLGRIFRPRRQKSSERPS